MGNLEFKKGTLVEVTDMATEHQRKRFRVTEAVTAKSYGGADDMYLTPFAAETGKSVIAPAPVLKVVHPISDDWGFEFNPEHLMIATVESIMRGSHD